MSNEGSASIEDQIHKQYPWLGEFRTEVAHAFVHDVIAVITGENRYALKLYRPGVRTAADLHWETGLTKHLTECDAPVVPIIDADGGPIAEIEVDDVMRSAVMTEWASGAKPSPNEGVYRLLGATAARIHDGADSYVPFADRETLDAALLIDRQIDLLRPALQSIGRLAEVEELSGSLRTMTTNSALNWGICHNDLTLDNVHVDDDVMVAFDFDSARPSWRSLEPALTYIGYADECPEYWQAWIDGYRSVREFSDADLAAVPAFAIMHQFENTAWKLNLTPTGVENL